MNPDARDQADEADREMERSLGRPRGPLHGVPVLLKDSMNTADRLNTTVGSYALLGAVARRDATVVERLREAGAVVVGKASVSEWYNFRSFGIPGGWCARSGQGVVSSTFLLPSLSLFLTRKKFSMQQLFVTLDHTRWVL